jgi:hypothetical protein
MSMQEEAALASGDNADMSKVLGDQSFLSSILSSVSLFLYEMPGIALK